MTAVIRNVRASPNPASARATGDRIPAGYWPGAASSKPEFYDCVRLPARDDERRIGA